MKLSPQSLPQNLHKFTTIIVLAITLFFGGCEGNKSERDEMLAQLTPLLIDAAQEGDFLIVSNDKRSVNASCNPGSRVIEINAGMCELFESGRITKDQFLMVICHEIGHLNRLGHTDDPNDPYFCEDYADYYGMLLLDEINEDEHLGFDMYHAINVFLIIPGEDDGEHHSGEHRHAMLKKQLDISAAHAGQSE